MRWRLISCVLLALWAHFSLLAAISLAQRADARRDHFRDGKPMDLRPRVAWHSRDLARLEGYLAALNRPLDLSYEEKPLNALLEDLQSRIGCPILLDSRALADASIADDTPVTLRLPKAPARDILKTILRNEGLGWYPAPRGIVVTTVDEVERRLITVVYPVVDLVRTYEGASAKDDYDSLIDLIVSTIQPNSWRESGAGDGTIGPAGMSAAIAVGQTWQVHEEIDAFLTTLRTVRDQSGVKEFSPDTYNWRYRWGLETPASEQPRSALAGPRTRVRKRWSAPEDKKSPTRSSATSGGMF